MDNLKLIKALIITLGSALAATLGALALPLLLMIICNVVDWVSGLLAAPHRGQKISSDLARDGMVRKIGLWLLVVVGVIIDQLLLYLTGTFNIDVHVRFLVACIVTIWIICNELLSILENLNDIGILVPKFLQPIIKHIRTQAENQIEYPGQPEDNSERPEVAESEDK